MTLPRSLDDLRGLRAARWIRESTSGQFDAFGPDAQREQQDRAIERCGLVDTGLAWQVAHSGRTVGSTSQFAEMMAAAGGQYDVLVVGYVSRFARDLRTAVNARHDLHLAGAALLFADERILSSDEESWDAWAREAVEAESYSRKLARRIREGYAAKRRRLGEPGGRPPFGFVRTGKPPALEWSGDLRVRRVFDLSASGQSDRRVGSDVGLPLDTVRGILTNPIYVGQLRDGTPAAVAPVVDVATWDAVQRIRASRRTRGGKPETVRTYALPMLRCAACDARLIGDVGRYRHRKPCAAFTAARRRTAFRNRLVRSLGTSYPQELYEGALGEALVKAVLQPATMVAAAEIHRAATPEPDRLALRRVTAERDRALTRYRRDRDVVALEATMARLDAQELSLVSITSDEPAPWSGVADELRDLVGLWSQAEPAERRRIAELLFAEVHALGCREMIATPSSHAITLGVMDGVQSVTVVGARGFGPVTVTFRTPPRTPLRIARIA
ncbi:MAG TPA: recombinase family protein [Candidatus Limnocylindrales bacterium]|nr:recombinase family protein [Candidatus Limnocylindrales bacterium]